MCNNRQAGLIPGAGLIIIRARLDGVRGTAVKKDSLEIVTEQVRLEGGFKRGGRIRVVECLRQINEHG